jgi:hypothetical protein
MQVLHPLNNVTRVTGCYYLFYVTPALLIA